MCYAFLRDGLPVHSQPPSLDLPASSSEDEDGVGTVAGQQPQTSQWVLPPKPGRRVLRRLLAPSTGKNNEAAHLTG
jgi:hypothetical protein